MALVLIIAGAVWFSFSLIFVLALMRAARRSIPPRLQPATEPVANAEQLASLELPCGLTQEDASVSAEVEEPVSVTSGIALASIPSPIGMPE